MVSTAVATRMIPARLHEHGQRSVRLQHLVTAYRQRQARRPVPGLDPAQIAGAVVRISGQSLQRHAGGFSEAAQPDPEVVAFPFLAGIRHLRQPLIRCQVAF